MPCWEDEKKKEERWWRTRCSCDNCVPLLQSIIVIAIIEVWVLQLKKKPFSEQGSWKVIPLHENNRPYLALSIPKDIMELWWKPLLYVAYSSHKESSDYHFFRSIFYLVKFIIDVQNFINKFTASKTESFISKWNLKTSQRLA